jgi:molybdate transport system regulatory protein
MRICHNEAPSSPGTTKTMDTFNRFLKQNIEVRSKVWLQKGGSPLMGAGRAELLRAVERTGSINAAAKELGMDYRRAWGLIDSMEKRLNFKLVIRRRGGSGRGTSLTDEGRRVLDLYERLERRAQESIDRQFGSIFKRSSKGK